MLKALKLEGQSLLVGLGGPDKSVYLSGRNVPDVEVSLVDDWNALAVLRPAKLLLTRSAVDRVQEKFRSQAANGAEAKAAG